MGKRQEAGRNNSNRGAAAGAVEEAAAEEGVVAAAGQGQGERGGGDSLPRGLNEPHRAQPSVLYCIKGEPGQRVRRWQMNEPINSNKDDSSSRGRQQAER